MIRSGATDAIFLTTLEVRRTVTRKAIRYVAAAMGLTLAGCGSAAGIFNPAFVNTQFGGVFPLTPGPSAAFILIRTINNTNQVVEFIVTIERDELLRDTSGNFQTDDQGNFITRPTRETVRLNTFPNDQARELGVLFACGESPVTLVGLGENLLPTDSAVFVGGTGPAGTGGFGVSAAGLNPLALSVGNFNCGDTIIFRAFRNTRAPGGVALESLLLPGSEQPLLFAGPSTFASFEQILAAQAAANAP